MTGDAVAARALTLVGTRFRLHGREADGLDCVGVIAAALGRTDAPTGYPLRSGDVDAVAAALEPQLRRVAGEPAAAGRPGDVLLMRTGPVQLHLGVRTVDGTVHADAGLGRVVLRPGPPAWPVLAAWRCEGED